MAKEKKQEKKQKQRLGWVCPACGVGNNPWAMVCGACPRTAVSVTDTRANNTFFGGGRPLGRWVPPGREG